MAQRKPDQPALAAGHIIVGVVVAVVAARFFTKSLPGVVAAAIVGIALHDMLDAPVSQAVSNAGL